MPPLVQYFKIAASQQRKQFFKQLGAKSQLLYEMLASLRCNSISMLWCVTIKLMTNVYAVFQLYPWLIFGPTGEVFLCFASNNYFPSPFMTSFFLVKHQ